MDFTLRDIPPKEAVERLAKKYRDLDVISVLTALKLLKVSKEVMTMGDKYFARYNISGGKFAVLMLLFRYHEQGGLPPSILADKAGVTKATMTGLIEGLEKMKLIKKVPLKKDRRSVEIHLNENGIRFLDSILPEHFQRTSSLYSNLSRKEKAQLLDLLDKVSDSIDEFEKGVVN